MDLSAVIFDFNGVLFWDTPLHEEAWRRIATHLRGFPLSNDEMMHHVHGRVNQDIFGYVLDRPISNGELQVLADNKEALYRDLCLSGGQPLTLSPGATDLLDWLHDTKTPFTIATSSAWPNVAFYIDQLNLGRWFNLDQLIYDRGEYPGKPAPDIYLAAAATLEKPPANCIVVEDSLAGILSARDAGIGHIVALGPAADQGNLRAVPGVTSVVEHLGQFPRRLLAGVTRQ